MFRLDANPQRRSVTSFDLGPAGLPSHRWIVQMTFSCPKCGGEGLIGSIESGGVALNCEHCGYNHTDRAVTSDQVLGAVLAHAASLKQS
jgi:DNA-directed RNA polymerase subunit RPC12/RpoP